MIDAIDEFENSFENDYDMNNEYNNTVIQALENARRKVDGFIRHPEGNGNTKVWDNVGF